MNLESTLDRKDLEVSFSSKVFDLETIKKAAYMFTDVCSIGIDVVNDDIVCRLSALKQSSDISLSEIADLLRNEALDQDLRRKIANETEPMRNAILAYAFSRTGLQHGE
ncbi:MAG: His-Xaa-Ser system protein HxsD [Candidatus Obscuribacterales bacterium]|nr:His-Xaa-Ser system protein HxsD [Candidatus Obscuribacterales bacterium]